MKMKFMLKYFISLLGCLSMSFGLLAQEQDISVVDSLVVTEKYGLRLGVDLSKLTRSFIESDYKGIEINGDYRITHRIYIAAEVGNEERTTVTDYLNSTAKGSYLKAGIDYNMHNNWGDLENLVYFGLRFGISNFNQTLNSYTIYDTNNQTWGQTEVLDSKKFSGLNAGWLEFMFGFKAEVLTNLFMGLNVQLKGRLFEAEPDNFENLYIPGFGRTFDSGRFGMGFGYNISYLIPLYKKTKK